MRRIKRLYILSGLLALGAASWLFAQGGPEEIRLTVGKGIVIDYPSDIARISTSNADIVDASPVTGPRNPGARQVFWDRDPGGLEQDPASATFTTSRWSEICQPLRRLLKETFPSEDIHVQSSRDSLSLTGKVSNKDTAGPGPRALATPFAKTVVNNLQVAKAPVEKQVLLRVKFAEFGSAPHPTSSPLT